ncbi:MAG: hypothetical protein OXG85_07215 [Chloroflexi bacterium]|nr:hypothetical protein [Chloroflexota bacterium]
MSTSVVDAFCFRNPLINAALHIACVPFILELTRLGLKMEGMIARDGHLKGASEWLLEIGAKRVRAQGAEHVPLTGPVLFVGNHAGLGDAHTLLMASPRCDTHILANDFGILPGLRAMRRHVIVADPSRPVATFRACLRHLRAGKSLLLYPRGEVEADPCLDLELALDSLAGWSASLELFARHVPELSIVPVAVGGLISRRALRNPVVRRYRERDKRHFLAATFQMMFPLYRDPLISLVFGMPLKGDRANRREALAQMSDLLRRVEAEQRRLMNKAAHGV